MRYLFMAVWITTMLSIPAYANDGTKVTINAQSSGWFNNDAAQVFFHVMAQGKKQSAIRQQVDRISHAISSRLSREHELTVTTANRRMVAIEDDGHRLKQRKIVGWKMVQSTRIVTRKPASIPTWLTAIEQQGAQLDGISLQLSQGRREQATTTLLKQAIARFHDKASTIAEALGNKAYAITQLQTSTTPPHPMEARLATPALTTALAAPGHPTLDQGMTQIRVRISGTIMLKNSSFPIRTTNRP